jgi:glycosyltransferase involved in cell wall biosynthesis
VGSIAFDSVRTPFGERQRMLGGSTVHFSLAASFFTEVRVVGSVGWLTPVKGHRVLIQAIACLHSTHPDLHAVIVGTGPLQEALADLAKEVGIGKAVHFLGMPKDIPECLASFEVFVLPSLNEGMGRALIEAMAAGVPVVTSAAAGASSVVREAGAGVVVDDYASRSFAEALRALVTDPERRRSLGARGPAGAAAFDVRQLAPRLASALERAAHPT